MTLLLRTLAGSRLYGLDTPTSDIDIYEVHSEPFNTNHKSGTPQREVQFMEGSYDVTKVTLSLFMERAVAGSHQALDAMFSRRVEVDKIGALRYQFFADRSMRSVYHGIIKEVALKEEPRKRRHAVRFAYNLLDMMETGRYNPTLTPERIEEIRRISHLPTQEFYVEIRGLLPFPIVLK